MRKFLVVVTLTALFLGLTATPATATIHPIVASFCSKVVALGTNITPVDPVGQTPVNFEDPSSWDQSDFRALLATGVLTFTPDGPVLDLTKPAAQKWITFGVLNPDFPAFIHCSWVASP